MQQSARRLTLRKDERLYERKAIEEIFSSGKAITEKPIRLLWINREGNSTIPVKAAFSVPRRTFKHAVDRNLLRRRMKEAYRKNKPVLYKALMQQGKEYLIMLIYTDVKKCEYAEIESKIVLTLQRLIKQAGGKQVPHFNG